MIEFIKAGKTLKAHGLNGELEIDLDPDLRQDILKQKVLFIYHEGNHIPFFIEKIRDDGRFFVKFEDVQDPEYAKVLSHKDIFTDVAKLPKTTIKKMDVSKKESAGLEGYLLIDQQSGNSGKIISIQEFPGQWMAEIQSGLRTFHIPIHEDFIIHLDPEKMEITVQLPDGIWDL
ncbi:MAG: hypothetical protein IPH93_12435 [Saprospiraceae bacterium]|nr:hypothetical protein [Saprospiraceae bacterium]MBK7812752.1 hypothetical protein [Saprospiraceae bacterium]MBK9630943.1 hypothetical protein [Saprospiraceae bacterium]